MGKLLIQQRRGKGNQRYKVPSKKYIGKVSHISEVKSKTNGIIIDLVNSIGHYAPIAKVKYDNGKDSLMFAPDGIKVGDNVSVGGNDIKEGNVIQLKDVPEGTLIYNIESRPGDGGKFCRSSGTFARLTAKTKNSITIILPSKKEKRFNPNCRANIGTVAGSGRLEKPLIKAGRNFFKRRARNKMYPSVSGNSMNAVDHPFGGSSSNRNKMPRQSSRHSPPGRKVGSISPKRTGKKR
jgi:large subunit ribosomal protein L2